MENIENLPPLSPVMGKSSAQFVNLRIRFEDSVGGTDGMGARAGGPLLGSSVSKIKERFQKNEKAAGDANHMASSSSLSSSSRVKEAGDRSPEIKKMRVTDGQGHSHESKSKTSSTDTISGTQHHPTHTPPLSPTHSSSTNLHKQHSPPSPSSHIGASIGSRRRKSGEGAMGLRGLESHSDSQLTSSEPSLLEATNHVQRFNYTRAMFARMEEENKKAQEREKIIRRKPSPSRPFPGSMTPQLSSVAVSIGQEPAKKRPPARDQRHDFRRPKSMSDVPSVQLPTSSESFKRLSDSSSSVDVRLDNTKRNQNGNAVLHQPAPKQQSENCDPLEASQPDQILRSRRPHRTPYKRDDSGDRNGKYYNNVDTLKALEDCVGGQVQTEDKTSDSDRRSTFNKTSSHRDGIDSAERSSSSDLSSSPPPKLPHSSRLEHSIRPGYRARTQAATSSSGPSVHSKMPDSNDSETTLTSSSVIIRQRNQPVASDTDAKKRFSKEDIAAALEKADTYLANMTSPDDTKTEKTKDEMDSPRKQSQRESAAARRKFLYGPDSSSSPAGSQVDLGKHDEHEQIDSPVHQEVPEVNESPSSQSVLSSVSPSFPTATAKSSTSVVLKSPSSSNESLNVEASLPPPSYHEATDPPPYHEATSSASMLISQKVFMSQQPTSISTVSGNQPKPIPRRIAPTPPLPKKPPVGNGAEFEVVPPPAPEPGSSEFTGELGSPAGSEAVVLLDSEAIDDLILPEEHLASHDELGLQNGELDSTTTSFVQTEFLITRESGDGREDNRQADVVLSDGDSLEIDYGSLTFIEIAAISSEEDDDSSGDEISYHKPSRVCFSRSPIKVFATYSTNDYDRRNEDVDPVAASAEYELEKRVEKMDVFPVLLQKGSEGLGLSIIGMGVGADAGLEKLGIFIKTLTPNGAAQRSNQIEVNDQIIEVDGKSLVGVTQAYAASVLRNTSGEVNFLIGRERDPSKSEVARLIQQSLEQDRRREEMREKEQQRLHQLEASFQPKDEVLDRLTHGHQQQHEVAEDSGSDVAADEKEDNETSHHHQVDSEFSLSEKERLQLEQETAAGDTTPQSVPSNGEDVGDSSPELTEVQLTKAECVAVEGLEERIDSSSDSASPDMENEKLYVRMKESQYRLSVAEAEITKLKVKLLSLESAEGQKRILEKKVDEMARKSQEKDKHYDSLKKELSQYKDMMVASQSQHIELERKVKELGALEKKYHKAKKLIKDYQLREKDFIQERESLLEQQTEKDQQYNSLVKSLKDRIFMLEKDLAVVQKAAGLPPIVTSHVDIEEPISPSKPTPLVRASHSVIEEPLSPLNQSTDDVLDMSTCSEISDPATSPVLNDSFSIEKSLSSSTSPLTVDLDHHSMSSFDAVEDPFRFEFESLLNMSPKPDSSTSRDEASLLLSSSGGARQTPTRKVKAQDSLEEQDSSSELTESGSIHSSLTDQAESGLDMWNKHDRKDDSNSDTSSSVSQTSYDPSRPSFKSGNSEIPDMAADDTSTNSDGPVTLISAKSSSSPKGFLPTKFSWKPSKGRDNDSKGGVVLLSNRPLAHSDPGLDSAGVFLTSRTQFDSSFQDIDASSLGSDAMSSLMVSEPDIDGSGKYVFNISHEGNPAVINQDQSQLQPGPITEWSIDGVCLWLTALDLDKYIKSFREKNVSGSQLLQLDSSRLKAVGVVSSKDRELLKKKIKEMRVNAEREKKIQEKERKQKEKEQKKMSKKK